MEICLGDAAFRKAVEESLDGILITIPDGRILYANPAACSLLQRSAEAIIVLGRQRITSSDDPRWGQALEERRRTGRVRTVAPFLRPDGSSFLADVSSSVFRENDGTERTVVVFRDVTDRIRLEQRLTASNEITRSLLAGDPIDRVLGSVAHHARTLLGATDAAVITAGDAPGSVLVRAADGPAISELVGRSYTEGVAVEVMASRRSLVVDDLTSVALSPDGRSLGLGPAIVVPILSRDRVFGNLLVGAAPGSRRYGEDDLSVVQMFAQAAGVALALGLARAEADRRQEQLAAQLQVALRTRVIIEQAKGVISASRGVTVDEAFEQMRSYARRHSARLHEVASAVVERRLLP